jgi:nitrite reductase (NADH) small subunit
VVTVGDREVALINIGGDIHALENLCPHRGGPLGFGDLKGHLLYCPLHAWPFDVRTGQCALNPQAKVATFDVRVVEGMILVAPRERTCAS